MEITLEQLRATMPLLKLASAQKYLPEINKACAEWQINTPKRIAAFLAQLAHESGQLRYFRELDPKAAYNYDTRVDLGHTPERDNDAAPYIGRGPIQLTGKANYIKAGKALGIDLVNNPIRAEQLDVCFRVAGWFWSTNGLNELADVGDYEAFKKITKRINGGYTHLEDRVRYWSAAKKALGVA